MVQSFDDSLAAAFEMVGGLDAEYKKRLEAEKIATRAMIDQLEAKYSARGLKFTVPFSGAVPVQAYGHLDGMRFYFRFRGNHGSLKVGPFIEELEVLYAKRRNEDVELRKQRRIEAGVLEEDIWPEPEHYPAAETDRDYYPHVIAKHATVQGENPEDIYNGFLTDQQAHDIFIQLVEALKDIPEEEQMEEGFKIWMYEGRAAMQVWSEERDRKLRAAFEAKQAREKE